MELNGISAIVTGGASGLGAATAGLLADRGARVVVADLDVDRGKTLAATMNGVFVRVDVRDTDQVIEAVEHAKELGPLRAVVNCAGIGSASRTIGRDGDYGSAHDLDAFRRVLEINTVGTFNVIRIAATAISKTEPLDGSERGAIVNTASLAAFEGQIGQAAYSASKGAIVGMTLPIARDLAVVGVRVNTIAPGLIDTPIYGTGPAAEEFKTKLAKDVVFPKRLGFSWEFASLALELLSNSYMNGETLRIDGAARLQPR